jgi:hypothetical protein
MTACFQANKVFPEIKNTVKTLPVTTPSIRPKKRISRQTFE